MPPTPGHTRNEDILSLLPLCRFIASTYPGLFSDRYQDAVVGAIQSVDRYVPGGEASLATYAHQRIRGAVKDGLRTEDHLTRRQRARVNERNDWLEEHPQQRPPDSLGPPDPGILHLTGQDALFVEEGYARVDAETAVAQGLATLDARDRKALTDYYLLGLRNADMAATLGVHPVRMSQVRIRAEQRMRAAMDRLGRLPPHAAP